MLDKLIWQRIDSLNNIENVFKFHLYTFRQPIVELFKLLRLVYYTNISFICSFAIYSANITN